jgi:hypothetical protein
MKSAGRTASDQDHRPTTQGRRGGVDLVVAVSRRRDCQRKKGNPRRKKGAGQG